MHTPWLVTWFTRAGDGHTGSATHVRAGLLRWVPDCCRLADAAGTIASATRLLDIVMGGVERGQACRIEAQGRDASQEG